jgi:hypothetical protein
MRRVIVESPYAGKSPAAIDLNVLYVRAALNHCLHNGDAPFASHGLYTLPGVLDDQIPEERALGMKAGFAFIETTAATIVYEDLGVSGGMISGIKVALELGHPIERRRISGWEKVRPCTSEHGKESIIALDGVLACTICGRSVSDQIVTSSRMHNAQSRIVPAPRMGNAGPVAGAARAAGAARGVVKGKGRSR